MALLTPCRKTKFPTDIRRYTSPKDDFEYSYPSNVKLHITSLHNAYILCAFYKERGYESRLHLLVETRIPLS